MMEDVFEELWSSRGKEGKRIPGVVRFPSHQRRKHDIGNKVRAKVALMEEELGTMQCINRRMRGGRWSLEMGWDGMGWDQRMKWWIGIGELWIV